MGCGHRRTPHPAFQQHIISERSGEAWAGAEPLQIPQRPGSAPHYPSIILTNWKSWPNCYMGTGVRMASLLCMLGWHTRSRGRARREGAQWISRCRRCNRPMRRADNGKWRLDRSNRKNVEANAFDDFSETPEADRPRQGPRRWLPRTGLRQIRIPRLHIRLPFRRRAQD